MFGRIDFGHDLPCSISRRVVTFEVWCFQICSLLVKTEVAGASAFKLTTTLDGMTILRARHFFLQPVCPSYEVDNMMFIQWLRF